jgi:hypothetical protein
MCSSGICTFCQRTVAKPLFCQCQLPRPLRSQLDQHTLVNSSSELAQGEPNRPQCVRRNQSADLAPGWHDLCPPESTRPRGRGRVSSNSIIRVIAKELRRLGLRGGLGDDRALRETIYEMVLLRVETQNANPTSGEAPRTDEIGERFDTLPHP